MCKMKQSVVILLIISYVATQELNVLYGTPKFNRQNFALTVPHVIKSLNGFRSASSSSASSASGNQASSQANSSSGQQLTNEDIFSSSNSKSFGFNSGSESESSSNNGRNIHGSHLGSSSKSSSFASGSNAGSHSMSSSQSGTFQNGVELGSQSSSQSSSRAGSLENQSSSRAENKNGEQNLYYIKEGLTSRPHVQISKFGSHSKDNFGNHDEEGNYHVGEYLYVVPEIKHANSFVLSNSGLISDHNIEKYVFSNQKTDHYSTGLQSNHGNNYASSNNFGFTGQTLHPHAHDGDFSQTNSDSGNYYYKENIGSDNHQLKQHLYSVPGHQTSFQNHVHGSSNNVASAADFSNKGNNVPIGSTYSVPGHQTSFQNHAHGSFNNVASAADFSNNKGNNVPIGSTYSVPGHQTSFQNHAHGSSSNFASAADFSNNKGNNVPIGSTYEKNLFNGKQPVLQGSQSESQSSSFANNFGTSSHSTSSSGGNNFSGLFVPGSSSQSTSSTNNFDKNVKSESSSQSESFSNTFGSSSHSSSSSSSKSYSQGI